MCLYKKVDKKQLNPTSVHCTEMPFASFLFGEFITAILENPPERKLANARLCILTFDSNLHSANLTLTADMCCDKTIFV